MPVRSALLSPRRWMFVAISGPSMVPTLRHGDRVLALADGNIAAGDVVLARFRELPDRLVVKRAVRPVGGGWWLASDNAFAGGDSATHGVADVTARVVWRFRAGWPSRLERVPIGSL